MKNLWLFISLLISSKNSNLHIFHDYWKIYIASKGILGIIIDKNKMQDKYHHAMGLIHKSVCIDSFEKYILNS